MSSVANDRELTRSLMMRMTFGDGPSNGNLKCIKIAQQANARKCQQQIAQQ